MTNKLTRSKLKGIVKECLMEILSEGISATPSKTTKTTSVTARQKRENEEKRLREHRDRFEVKVENTVSELTDDPVMQSIFADTAKTTMQEQIQHEGKSGRPASPTPESISGNASGIDLNNIFEGASDVWSTLAFSQKKSQ